MPRRAFLGVAAATIDRVATVMRPYLESLA